MLTLAKYNDTIAALCGEDLSNSCNTVQNSKYSYLINIENENQKENLKVPVSLAGVFFYTLLFIISIVGYIKLLKNKQLSKSYPLILFVVGLIGVLFSAVYTWIQAELIEAFCKFCVISTINTVILFILIIIFLYMNRKRNQKTKSKKKNEN